MQIGCQEKGCAIFPSDRRPSVWVGIGPVLTAGIVIVAFQRPGRADRPGTFHLTAGSPRSGWVDALASIVLFGEIRKRVSGRLCRWLVQLGLPFYPRIRIIKSN